MDVWVDFMDPGVASIVEVYGMLEHECVPEPATLALLAIGGVLSLLRRK